jgi:hypothetical protein
MKRVLAPATAIPQLVPGHTRTQCLSYFGGTATRSLYGR